MQRVDGTLRRFMVRDPPPSDAELKELVNGLQVIIRRLDTLGASHNDLHTRNVGFFDGQPRRWVLLDFGAADKYDPDGDLTDREVEPEAHDLDTLLEDIGAESNEADLRLIALIKQNIQGFFNNGNVPPEFAAKLEALPVAESASFVDLAGPDILAKIAIWFSYKEILLMITEVGHRNLARLLTSNALWSRMVFRDYPYVFEAIMVSPETKQQALAVITGMAKDRTLSPDEHGKRFWKRVYEWALVTSREVVVY